MNPKNIFYIVITFVVISLFIEHSFDNIEKYFTKSEYEKTLLNNVVVENLKDLEKSNFQKKLFGGSGLTVKVSVYDSLNNKSISKDFEVTQKCFDTITIGQKLNYNHFSVQCKDDVLNEYSSGIIWKLFIVIIALSMSFFAVKKARDARYGN